jgi:hypothetical protein
MLWEGKNLALTMNLTPAVQPVARRYPGSHPEFHESFFFTKYY